MTAEQSPGRLFIVSAPSGAGKTSLVKALLERDAALKVCVSHTTRRRRPTETDGVNYHFVDKAQFEAMVAANAFLEHADVFGNCYGTALSSVREEFASGADVILEIDWQGAAQVRARWPEAVSIFILPPSRATLRERLKGRGEDSAEVIERRLAAARTEVSHHRDFDYLLVNDSFEPALQTLEAIVTAERCRRSHAERALKPLLDDLLSEP